MRHPDGTRSAKRSPSPNSVTGQHLRRGRQKTKVLAPFSSPLVHRGLRPPYPTLFLRLLHPESSHQRQPSRSVHPSARARLLQNARYSPSRSSTSSCGCIVCSSFADRQWGGVAFRAVFFEADHHVRAFVNQFAVMGDHNDCGSLLCQVSHLLTDARQVAGVYARCGFIKNDDVSFYCCCRGNDESLFLSAGQGERGAI